MERDNENEDVTEDIIKAKEDWSLANQTLVASVSALKRSSALSAVGDEEQNDPAAKVSRIGSQSGEEQSSSTCGKYYKGCILYR